MPKIKIDHVVSFSSEDTVHVANNVLLTDPAKKWKCKTPGERSATIVLQLEKATVISSIDIGNENSAYIEILVSRSESSDDYKVLLVMSSFMTPLEARQTTNVNKVRMFTKDQLSQPECSQKWDRVKIVCTQPFNRHVQYGLSFVNFQSPEDKTSVQATVGKFSIREESPDNVSVGSLFARRKDEPVTAAAAIREASTSNDSPNKKAKIKINPSSRNSNSNSSNNDNKPLARNRNELLYSKDEEEPNAKIDKILEKTAKEKKVKEEEGSKKNMTPKADLKKNNNKAGHSRESSGKRKQNSSDSDSPKKKMKLEFVKKPFYKMLEGVVLVISGIQNPDRGNLRTMALAMGAKYKPDWDNSCTHLICAFANTPKFNQVRGKGKIVKKDWIEECHRQRKKLPWRRFCLDKKDTNKPESEDEIWEELEEKKVEKKVETKQPSSDDDSTDAEGYDDTKMQKKIEEIQSKKNQKNNIFSQDTEDEKDENKDDLDISSKLSEFFDLRTFYIDQALDTEVYKTLERYVIAYKGLLVDDPAKDIDYFITTEDNVKKFKEKNAYAIFVRPDWLWDCHNSQDLVPVADYKL